MLKYDKLSDLTKREKQILNMLALGLTYFDIEKIAKISFATVKTHVANIFSKLNVNSLQELVTHYYLSKLDHLESLIKTKMSELNDVEFKEFVKNEFVKLIKE